MKLLFAGTPAVAVPALRALLGSRHEVLAVLTRPDAPTGRGRALTPSPVAATALEEGLELLRPVTPRDPEFLARLEALAPDCAPVVAYGGLLPKRALEIPRLGWINLHFSLLPAWRGAAPVQHAIWHGDEFTGASVFQIEESLDSGPVYGTLTEGIEATDTAGDLLGRLAVSGAGLLLSCLDAVADGMLTPVPQSADGVSLAPKLTTDDARVSWSKPAFAVNRQVRACTPAPGAWTTFRGDRLKLGPVSPVPDVVDLEAGELRAERRRVLIGTATHAVTLSTVQPRGRKAVAAPDWARGLHPALPGETDTDTEANHNMERME